jgi:hypothetical protein
MVTRQTDSLTSQHGGSGRRSNGGLAALAEEAVGPCQYAVILVLWTSAFVAIRSAGGHFAPGALGVGRLLVASLALGVVWLLSGGGWPARAAWLGIPGSGLLWFGLYGHAQLGRT